VQLGDLVCIDWNSEQNRLTFVREGENLAMPARRAEPVAVTRSAPARNGKQVEAPPVAFGPEPMPRMAR
jgi:hypothetical protein